MPANRCAGSAVRHQVFDMIDRRKLCSRLLEQENWRLELIENNQTKIAAA